MQDIHSCSISICHWSHIKYLLLVILNWIGIFYFSDIVYQLIEEQIHCYNQVFLVGPGSNKGQVKFLQVYIVFVICTCFFMSWNNSVLNSNYPWIFFCYFSNKKNLPMIYWLYLQHLLDFIKMKTLWCSSSNHTSWNINSAILKILLFFKAWLNCYVMYIKQNFK